MKYKFLLGIVLVAAASGGLLAYAWNRTTAVPQWYESNAVVSTALPAEGLSAQDLITSKLAADTDGDQQLEVTLNETEINQIVTSAATENPIAVQLLTGSQGIKTHIANGQVESGTVINLSTIPVDKLPEHGQATINTLTERLPPMLTNQNLYIGIASRPQVVNGQIQLGNDTVIKIGHLSMPLNEVANQLGLSQQDLETQLSNLLVQQGVSLENLQISDGQLTLIGPNL